MRQPGPSHYHHTQRGLSAWLCCAGAVPLVIIAFFLPLLVVSILFLVSSIVMLVVGCSLAHLTVEDEGDQLALRFGPLPLFRKRVRYDDIIEVEKGRTTFLDGWGIHGGFGYGVWNIWGFDCVVLRLKAGTLKVGTDDADGLAAFLKDQLQGTSRPAKP